MEHTDNINIVDFKPLITPEQLKNQIPLEDYCAQTVVRGRHAIEDILNHKDSRKLVIVGPCSLYDYDSTMDYAERLKKLQYKVLDKIQIVMRAYFEKPRTTLGWKGMLYDPYMDDSGDIEEGIRLARKILAGITKMGIPAGTEILDPIVPQFITDLVSWAAIGARTTESQIHRQMASGLSMPIGFKNATDGNLQIAIDAIKSARGKHSFMGIDCNGKVIIAETRGNKYGHLVMRGGNNGPNFTSEYVAFAEVLLKKAKAEIGIIIDCSHSNSYKDHRKQRDALLNVAQQIKEGNKSIAGVMLESFINEGSQPVDKLEKLKYGVSVTDACIGWEETEELVTKFAQAV
jgi:3-deoxy-7-phosphoheptulonate synthase